MKLDLDRVPSTLDEAVVLIKQSMDTSDIEELKKVDDPSAFHFTVGRYLRNSWSLWTQNDTPLHLHFGKLGISHADDISSIILKKLWCNETGNDFDLKQEIDQKKEHWLKTIGRETP